MKKIDEGWYEDFDGTVYQRWYKACGSPASHAGWYIWLPGAKVEEFAGPFDTLREAKRIRPKQ